MGTAGSAQKYQILDQLDLTAPPPRTRPGSRVQGTSDIMDEQGQSSEPEAPST